MKLTTILCAAILSSAAGNAFACYMPPLVAIPAKDKIGDKAAQISVEVQAYFNAMNTYTSCVQAELTAAGDKASPLMKAVLTQRNNVAVAEANAVQKLYAENVAAGLPAP